MQQNKDKKHTWLYSNRSSTAESRVEAGFDFIIKPIVAVVGLMMITTTTNDDDIINNYDNNNNNNNNNILNGRKKVETLNICHKCYKNSVQLK